MKSLGFDVLAGVPPVEELQRLLAPKRGAIKTILLDQVREDQRVLKELCLHYMNLKKIWA